MGPLLLPDDDDDVTETPVPPATVYVTSISWNTELSVIKEYFEQFGRIKKEKGDDCINFKENFVTSSAGKKRHCGVLIQFETEESAEASTNGQQATPGEIEGRSIKVWRPAGRALDQEWASLASVSSQIRLLVENSGRDSVAVDDIPRLFAKMFGKPLQSTEYSFPTLPHLIYSMSPMGGGLSLEQASGSSSAMRVRLAGKAKPTKGSPERKVGGGAKQSPRASRAPEPQSKPSKSKPAAAPKQQQKPPKSPSNSAQAANTLVWSQLNIQQKAAATALEWNQRSWDSGKSVPACEHLWSRLTELQQKMAAVIGYTAQTWDAELQKTTVPVPAPAPFMDPSAQQRAERLTRQEERLQQAKIAAAADKIRQQEEVRYTSNTHKLLYYLLAA